jgi:DNA processing protein
MSIAANRDGRLEIVRFLASALLPKRIGRRRLREAVAAAGGAAPLLDSLLAGGTPPGASEAERKLLAVSAVDRGLAARLEDFAASPLARFLILGEPDYPPRLAESSDPPVVLFGRSAAPPGPIGSALAIAVVGARQASPYGREAAAKIAGELAASGVVVVSGLARGIDAEAHRATLEAKGRTIAVLGNGIDHDYPPEHARLAREIVDGGGAILSEYPPGTPARPSFFPERNRIIAGLACGVLVVEAAERSGSLITARLALEEGREVWAVPGSIFSATSGGTNRLIREGARVATSAADLLLDLPAELVRPLLPPAPSPAEGVGELPHPWLLDLLSIENPTGTDDIAARGRRPVAEVVAALVECEIGGYVRSIPGDRWARTRKGLGRPPNGPG